MIGRASQAIAAAWTVAVAIGCTPPHAIRQILDAEESMDQPPLLLVYDFAVEADDLVVDAFGPAFLPARSAPSDPHAEDPIDRTGQQSRDEAVANTLAAAMVEKLRARGIRAERAGARTTPPREAILVKGQFVTVTGDGESPRMAIGLGPASAALRIQVQAYQVAETGQLRRIVERDMGGAGPFLAAKPDEPPPPTSPATAAVISGGLTFVLRSQANVEADTARLAELFAERAFDFYRRQGWIPGSDS